MFKIMLCVIWIVFVTAQIGWTKEIKALTYEAVYTAEYFVNTKGGLKREGTYHSNLDLTLGMNTEAAGWWKNGEVFIYVLENSGGSKFTGSIVGDLQTVSNIEAPRTLRLYEAWYQHIFFDETFSVLFGIHDYNSEFNVSELGGLYLNSSFGIQPDISGGARPSIFPLAAPAVRLKYALNEYWEFLFGVYDGDPGDPETDEHYPRSDFDSEGGVFIAGEIIHHFKEEAHLDFLKLGFWKNTGKFNDVVNVNAAGDSLERDDNFGGYIVMDCQLYQEQEGQGLGAFVQFGANNTNVNEVDMYVGVGFNYTGLIPGRDEDEVGLAVAHAIINDNIVDVGDREEYETAFELTYSAQIHKHLRIQPDVQYIIHPGAATGVKDAFVAGIRVEFAI